MQCFPAKCQKLTVTSEDIDYNGVYVNSHVDESHSQTFTHSMNECPGNNQKEILP